MASPLAKRRRQDALTIWDRIDAKDGPAPIELEHMEDFLAASAKVSLWGASRGPAKLFVGHFHFDPADVAYVFSVRLQAYPGSADGAGQSVYSTKVKIPGLDAHLAFKIDVSMADKQGNPASEEFEINVLMDFEESYKAGVLEVFSCCLDNPSMAGEYTQDGDGGSGGGCLGSSHMKSTLGKRLLETGELRLLYGIQSEHRYDVRVSGNNGHPCQGRYYPDSGCHAEARQNGKLSYRNENDCILWFDRTWKLQTSSQANSDDCCFSHSGKNSVSLCFSQRPPEGKWQCADAIHEVCEVRRVSD